MPKPQVFVRLKGGGVSRRRAGMKESVAKGVVDDEISVVVGGMRLLFNGSGGGCFFR